jgi:hypothetical protein
MNLTAVIKLYYSWVSLVRRGRALIWGPPISQKATGKRECWGSKLHAVGLHLIVLPELKSCHFVLNILYGLQFIYVIPLISLSLLYLCPTSFPSFS